MTMAKRAKYKSRATRRDEALDAVNNIIADAELAANSLRDAAQAMETADTDEEKADAKQLLQDAWAEAEAVSDPDASELESLADEMESWRDGLEEHFSATQKYEAVSECADIIRNAADTLGGTCGPAVPEEAERTPEAAEAHADELENYVSELQDAVSEAEGAEFPGMFG